MRRHLLPLLKKILYRELTFLPLIAFLLMGFRPGSGGMTPEARWHPAFYLAGPLAAIGLFVMWRRWLAFEAMALGMLLFLLVGSIGVILLNGFGIAFIHNIYNPMKHAMLFAWIGLVWAALALWRPAMVMALPASCAPAWRLLAAAWVLVALAAVATWGAYALQGHEELAGAVPFVGLVAARWLAGKWVKKAAA